MKTPIAGLITCRESTWLTSDARERLLTDEEKAALARHISDCSLCQGASAQFDVLFRQLAIFLAGGDGNGDAG